MVGQHANGLHRNQRIRHGLDFQHVFQDGFSLPGRIVIIRLLPGDCTWTRCGFVAGKKTFRRAVERNRAKRLMRETFRLAQHDLPGTFDMILIARRSILDGGLEAVQRDYQKLIARIPKMIAERTSTPQPEPRQGDAGMNKQERLS